MLDLTFQSHDEIINIGNDWGRQSHNGFDIYPEGKREKNLLIAPLVYDNNLQENYTFIIPGKTYLFKRSDRKYPIEYWMEIFSYQFGCIIDVRVPPAFVAFNTKSEEPGALIEWFYEPVENNIDKEKENHPREKYIPAGDIFKANIPNFERKKGRQHNFLDIFTFLSNPAYNMERNWEKKFIKMLTFDALIGNTDRHQDNWGIILKNIKNPKTFDDFKKINGLLAPAFDNGTSMGREINENKLNSYLQQRKYKARFEESELLKKYIEKGKPHIKWDIYEEHKNRSNHEVLLKKIIEEYAALKSYIFECLQFKNSCVETVLNNLLKFKNYDRNLNAFSEQRAEFMLKLICLRRDRLQSIVDAS